MQETRAVAAAVGILNVCALWNGPIDTWRTPNAERQTALGSDAGEC